MFPKLLTKYALNIILLLILYTDPVVNATHVNRMPAHSSRFHCDTRLSGKRDAQLHTKWWSQPGRNCVPNENLEFLMKTAAHCWLDKAMVSPALCSSWRVGQPVMHLWRISRAMAFSLWCLYLSKKETLWKCFISVMPKRAFCWKSYSPPCQMCQYRHQETKKCCFWRLSFHEGYKWHSQSVVEY